MAVIGVLLIPFLYVLASAVLPVPNASATSECYRTDYYSGFITEYYHNQGVMGDLDYYAGDMELYDNSTDHGAIWLGNLSQADPNNGWGDDWNQVGYLLGSVDNKTTNTTEVYDELAGPNTGAVATLYLYPTSEYPWGNHWFTDYNTGETEVIAGSTYGYYEGTYSLNYDVLGTSWMDDPTYTQQESNTEAYLGNSGGWCPGFHDTPFGTNGDLTDPTWNSSTELEIYDNTYGGEWEPWTPGSVATQNAIPMGYYNRDVYSNDDAWLSWGGGP